MWKYLDDEGASQGPYTTEQINTWYLQGYMPADREVWRDTGVVGEMPDFVKLGAVPELVAPAAGKVAEAFAQQQLYMQQQMMMMKKQQELAAGLAATVALKRDVHEVPCKFFLQGTCRKGDSCRFAHIVGAEIPPDPRVAEELRAKLLRESMAECDIPEGYFIGFVKSWNDTKGFGFISPAADENGLVPPDVFIHRLDICSTSQGNGQLDRGMTVLYKTKEMPNGQTRAWDVMNTDSSPIESDPNAMEGGGEYGWQGRVFRARNEADKDGHIPADNTTRGRFLKAPHESERHMQQQGEQTNERHDDRGWSDRGHSDRDRDRDRGYNDRGRDRDRERDRGYSDRDGDRGYSDRGGHSDRYRPY